MSERRDQSGFNGVDWSSPPWSELLAEVGDDLTIHVELWHRPIDPFEKGFPWWQWRTPCDCPDTTFGRNPHRWNCHLTPIWAQTIRDLDCNPWTVVAAREASFSTLYMRTFCCPGCGDEHGNESCGFGWGGA